MFAFRSRVPTDRLSSEGEAPHHVLATSSFNRSNAQLNCMPPEVIFPAPSGLDQMRQLAVSTTS